MSLIKKSLMTLAFVSIIGQANAAPITVTFGGTGTGTNFENFDELSLGLNSGTVGLPNIGGSLTFGGSQIVKNSLTNFYTNPFGDSTQYLSTYANGSSTFTFTQPLSYFGFLWGSVDPYNSISFYDSSNALIQTFTGPSIISASGVTASDPGAAGTIYANFASLVGIAKVIATSSVNAFELDNISTTLVAQTPLPAALPMFGAALMGMGAVARKKKVVA